MRLEPVRWAGRRKSHATAPRGMYLNVANVDTGGLRAYVAAHPDDFTFLGGVRQRSRHCVLRHVSAPAGFKTSRPRRVKRGNSRLHGKNFACSRTQSRGLLLLILLCRKGLNRIQAREPPRFARRYCAGFKQAIRVDGASGIDSWGFRVSYFHGVPDTTVATQSNPRETA